MTDLLGTVANIASILTFAGAITGYGIFQTAKKCRRKKIENYLWDLVINPRWAGDPGDRSVDQLVSELGMSERDIFDAAFNSRHVSRRLNGGTAPVSSRLRLSHADKNPQRDDSN